MFEKLWHPSPPLVVMSSYMAIIMYAVYDANLIASLTVTNNALPFNTLDDMVKQKVYRYGVQDGIIQYMLFEVT